MICKLQIKTSNSRDFAYACTQIWEIKYKGVEKTNILYKINIYLQKSGRSERESNLRTLL